jgi:hypothetical protein
VVNQSDAGHVSQAGDGSGRCWLSRFLAELKIAATLLRGLKIVFLAPTLSLVDQTTKALAKTFPKAKVRKDQLNDNLFDFKDDELPNISVMTPEHCLAMLCFNREIFTDVGVAAAIWNKIITFSHFYVFMISRLHVYCNLFQRIGQN